MLNLVLLLARVGDEEVVWAGKMTPGSRQGFVLFGALFLVVLLVVTWAVFFRKRRRRHQSAHHRAHQSLSRTTSEPENGKRPLFLRHRKRRRRRAHHHRNPTLAETGGLPQLHQDAPPPESLQT